MIAPLCSYKETQDGTYSLADILRFNIAMDEALEAYNKAMTASRGKNG